MRIRDMVDFSLSIVSYRNAADVAALVHSIEHQTAASLAKCVFIV